MVFKPNQLGGAKPNITELKNINLFKGDAQHLTEMERFLNPTYGFIYDSCNIIEKLYNIDYSDLGNLVREFFNKTPNQQYRPTNSILISENKAMTPYIIGIFLASNFLLGFIDIDDLTELGKIISKLKMTQIKPAGNNKVVAQSSNNQSFKKTIKPQSKKSIPIKYVTQIEYDETIAECQQKSQDLFKKYEWLSVPFADINTNGANNIQSTLLKKCENLSHLLRNKINECKSNVAILMAYWQNIELASSQANFKQMIDNYALKKPNLNANNIEFSAVNRKLSLNKTLKSPPSQRLSINLSKNITESSPSGNNRESHMILKSFNKLLQPEPIKSSVRIMYKFAAIPYKKAEYYHIFLTILWWIASQTNVGIKEYYIGINNVLGGHIFNINTINFSEQYTPLELKEPINSSDEFDLIIGKLGLTIQSLFPITPFQRVSLNDDITFPDCGETTVLNMIKLACYNFINNKIDISILKQLNPRKSVIKYFETYQNCGDNEVKHIFKQNFNSKQAWNYIVSNVPGLYYSRSIPIYNYEIEKQQKADNSSETTELETMPIKKKQCQEPKKKIEMYNFDMDPSVESVTRSNIINLLVFLFNYDQTKKHNPIEILKFIYSKSTDINENINFKIELGHGRITIPLKNKDSIIIEINPGHYEMKIQKNQDNRTQILTTIADIEFTNINEYQQNILKLLVNKKYGNMDELINNSSLLYSLYFVLNKDNETGLFTSYFEYLYTNAEKITSDFLSKNPTLLYLYMYYLQAKLVNINHNRNSITFTINNNIFLPLLTHNTIIDNTNKKHPINKLLLMKNGLFYDNNNLSPENLKEIICNNINWLTLSINVNLIENTFKNLTNLTVSTANADQVLFENLTQIPKSITHLDINYSNDETLDFSKIQNNIQNLTLENNKKLKKLIFPKMLVKLVLDNNELLFDFADSKIPQSTKELILKNQFINFNKILNETNSFNNVIIVYPSKKINVEPDERENNIIGITKINTKSITINVNNLDNSVKIKKICANLNTNLEELKLFGNFTFEDINLNNFSGLTRLTRLTLIEKTKQACQVFRANGINLDGNIFPNSLQEINIKYESLIINNLNLSTIKKIKSKYVIYNNCNFQNLVELDIDYDNYNTIKDKIRVQNITHLTLNTINDNTTVMDLTEYIGLNFLELSAIGNDTELHLALNKLQKNSMQRNINMPKIKLPEKNNLISCKFVNIYLDEQNISQLVNVQKLIIYGCATTDFNYKIPETVKSLYIDLPNSKFHIGALPQQLDILYLKDIDKDKLSEKLPDNISELGLNVNQIDFALIPTKLKTLICNIGTGRIFLNQEMKPKDLDLKNQTINIQLIPVLMS